MDRYLPSTPRKEHDVELAKSRLRVAAVQAGPAEMVRNHPWASVIGTFAGALALAGLFGGRGPSRAPDGTKRRSQGGLRLPPGLVQWAMSMGIQFIQTQLNKRAAEKGVEAADDHADTARRQQDEAGTASEEHSNAVG